MHIPEFLCVIIYIISLRSVSLRKWEQIVSFFQNINIDINVVTIGDDDFYYKFKYYYVLFTFIYLRIQCVYLLLLIILFLFFISFFIYTRNQILSMEVIRWKLLPKIYRLLWIHRITEWRTRQKAKLNDSVSKRLAYYSAFKHLIKPIYLTLGFYSRFNSIKILLKWPERFVPLVIRRKAIWEIAREISIPLKPWAHCGGGKVWIVQTAEIVEWKLHGNWRE